MTTPKHQAILEKWAPILDDESVGKITDAKKRSDMAVILENTVQEQAANAQSMQGLHEAVPSSSTANVSNYDPVIVGLLRRAMPQLIAYDFCGVQPMTMPTGLVFAARNRYTSKTGAEALFNEADSAFSAGQSTPLGSNPVDATNGLDPWDVSPTYGVQSGVTTAAGEDFGGATTLNQMTFTIEKHTVTAVERGLQAGYTVELAQDLKAVHGLDAESELSNLLSNQVIAELNRNLVRTLYKVASTGAQVNTATAGTFDLDVDANGRWSVERFKGLMFQIEREANRIAQTTRLGRGNLILCSSDVASALSMAGKFDIGGLGSAESLNVDEASVTFAGTLNGKYKVYVDPYAANGDGNQFCLVGYKGNGLGKAGMFYCPYVPLTMYKAIDPTTFQPKIAFKTRYAIAGNPLNGYNYADQDANPTTQAAFTLEAKSNAFFRIFRVTNIA